MLNESLKGVNVSCLYVVFFFQAEDGIRDYKVTGVQTCALPILVERMKLEVLLEPGAIEGARTLDVDPAQAVVLDDLDVGLSWSGCGGVRIDPTAGSAAEAGLWKVRPCVRRGRSAYSDLPPQ